MADPCLPAAETKHLEKQISELKAPVDKSQNVVIRMDVFTYKVGDRVNYKGQKGSVTRLLGSCGIEEMQYEVKFDNNDKSAQFCGSLDIGPVLKKYSYRGVQFVSGKTVTFISRFRDPRAVNGEYGVLGPFVIEEVLIGIKESNADPDRAVVLNVKSEDGNSRLIKLNEVLDTYSVSTK